MKGKKIVAVVLMLILSFSFSTSVYAHGTIGGNNAGQYVQVYTNKATKKTYVRCEVSAIVQWDVRMIDKNGKKVWEEKNSCHKHPSGNSVRDYSVGANVKYIELKLVPNKINAKIGFHVTTGTVPNIQYN